MVIRSCHPSALGRRYLEIICRFTRTTYLKQGGNYHDSHPSTPDRRLFQVFANFSPIIVDFCTLCHLGNVGKDLFRFTVLSPPHGLLDLFRLCSPRVLLDVTFCALLVPRSYRSSPTLKRIIPTCHTPSQNVSTNRTYSTPGTY